jgi:hypothetical protein
MRRKAYIIGILALGLAATAAETTPGLCRLVSSAQNFQYHFQDLKRSGGTLSPIERFVFSLVLANSGPGQRT